jgi:methionyl-tRNA formyltransferase
LFNSQDPTIATMYAFPPFARAYWRAVEDAINGPLAAAQCNPVMDAKYRSLVANGVAWCDGSALTDPTGVTAHRLAAEYDTGAILGQRSIAIAPAWSAWALAKKLDRPSLALLREVAGAFARGTPPATRAQDESLATAAPEPDDEMLAIRWSWTQDRIVRRVRAASPWPGAFTELGGEELVLTRVAPVSDFPRALAAGEATVHGGRAIVRTGDGAVALLEGRTPEGEALGAAALASRVQRATGTMAKDNPLI